jgi:NAD(P)H-dependent flavin oxidoreductase YrpB (nitropropane dioxygenase family)
LPKIAAVTVLESLGTTTPVVQAGMGGGISRHELAAAVSEAGGLGTIAVGGPEAIERELSAARGLTDRPIAVNVLLPFARASWFAAASSADAVVTFWGPPKRRTPGTWIHQCGSVGEARAAHAAGADAAIVQGVEAGGHVRGSEPALELLERARAAIPDPGFPLLLAGGIAERGDVERALDAGAAGAVAGTRFLLSPESRAHPGYKRRLLAAEVTLITELFGFGWPARHRVVANAATERQLGGGGVPLLNRMLNRAAAPGARLALPGLQLRLARAQRPGSRLLSPLGPTDDGPENLLDAGPLYAGETVARIGALRPAAEIVADLTP